MLDRDSDKDSEDKTAPDIIKRDNASTPTKNSELQLIMSLSLIIPR